MADAVNAVIFLYFLCSEFLTHSLYHHYFNHNIFLKSSPDQESKEFIAGFIG